MPGSAEGSSPSTRESGCHAILRPNGSVNLHPWTVEHEALDDPEFDPSSYEAVIEDVARKLGNEQCLFIQAGVQFRIHRRSLPESWVEDSLGLAEGLAERAEGTEAQDGIHARKRQLKDNAIRLYPDQRSRTPRLMPSDHGLLAQGGSGLMDGSIMFWFAFMIIE